MDYNILIVGGGIHGTGLLHDLCTRRVQGVHLVERSLLASGTSSRSTKLVHGGLRYLEHLVSGGLCARRFASEEFFCVFLRGSCNPCHLCCPPLRATGRPG